MTSLKCTTEHFFCSSLVMSILLSLPCMAPFLVQKCSCWVLVYASMAIKHSSSFQINDEVGLRVPVTFSCIDCHFFGRFSCASFVLSSNAFINISPFSTFPSPRGTTCLIQYLFSVDIFLSQLQHKLHCLQASLPSLCFLSLCQSQNCLSDQAGSSHRALQFSILLCFVC